MPQPDLSPPIRRYVYATLFEMEALGLVASTAGVAASTVGRAFRPPADAEHLVPTGGLLLAVLVELGRLGRLDVLEEVLRRAGLDVRVLPQGPRPSGRASCSDVRDAALDAAASAGSLVGAVRRTTADGTVTAAERRELVACHGQLEEALAALAQVVDSAAGLEVVRD